MATYSDSLGYAYGSAALPANGLNRASLAVVELDFAAIKSARSDAGATALATSDVIKVIPIAANTIVRNVGWVVDTGETVNNTAKLSLGDSSAAAGFAAAATIAATGAAGGVPTLDTGAFAPTLSGGKVYTAADAIQVTISVAVPEDAVVRIFAELVDISA